MDRRYQIFISSTYADLIEERDKVMRAVLQLKCFPAGMELFPAVDKNQFDYIKSEIDECDYYLLIIGARYGSMDKDGVSYTEKEYNYAVRKKIPVIAFLHNDIKSIPLGKADTDNKLIEKLEKFRKKVQKGRLVNYWTNSDDLKAKVVSSLPMAFTLQPRTGWIKANTVTSDFLQNLVADLKNEVNEIKATKQGGKKEKDTDSMNWDKEFTIRFYHYRDFSNILDEGLIPADLHENEKMTLTWRSWFLNIAQMIEDNVLDTYMFLKSNRHKCPVTFARINKYPMSLVILEASEVDPNEYTISAISLSSIRYKFLSNDLIESSSRLNSIWELTPKGKQLLAKFMSENL